MDASTYTLAKAGKLKLKGEKRKSHKKHKSSKHSRKAGEEADLAVSSKVKLQEELAAAEEDTRLHGGWWQVGLRQRLDDITGPVCLELGERSYLTALDTGLFTLGARRTEGEGPAPEEILVAVPVGGGSVDGPSLGGGSLGGGSSASYKIALKSGYGKYLSVSGSGAGGPEGTLVIGRSDAIGPRELWEPVVQEGKMALLGSNGCFLSLNDDGDAACYKKTAGPGEMVKIRSNTSKGPQLEDETPVEEKGSLVDAEVNYVKKFQSWQDRKLRLSKNEKSDLFKAKTEGNLHEVLLDRREKMKSDRFCK